MIKGLQTGGLVDFLWIPVCLYVFVSITAAVWSHVVTTALEAALQLAEQISAFPQQCLRADRSSAVYSCYDAPSFTQVQLVLYLCVFTSSYSSSFTHGLSPSAFASVSNMLCLSSVSVQAMQYEIDHGLPVVKSESVTGAARFSAGAGRGGKFS